MIKNIKQSIIAAQTGEQGKSFKVVAERVKELSLRVIQSTGEISELIAAVQTESGNAVSAIEDSNKSVATGASWVPGRKNLRWIADAASAQTMTSPEFKCTLQKIEARDNDRLAHVKIEAVKMITEQNYKVAEAARNLGIADNQLRRWKDKYAEIDDDTDNEELKHLRAENKRLRMERDILKKATAFFAKENS